MGLLDFLFFSCVMNNRRSTSSNHSSNYKSSSYDARYEEGYDDSCYDHGDHDDCDCHDTIIVATTMIVRMIVTGSCQRNSL